MSGPPEFMLNKVHQVAQVSRLVRRIPSEVEFTSHLRGLGFPSATLTQCNSIGSLLKHMWSLNLDPTEDFRVNHMVHEHAIAGFMAGTYLSSGEKSAAIFQNSALSNIGDGVISYAENYGIPFLAISTLRGFGEWSRPHESWYRRTFRMAKTIVGEKNVFGSRFGRKTLENLEKAAEVVLGDGENFGQAIMLLNGKLGLRETLPKTPPNWNTDRTYRPLPEEVKAAKGTMMEDYLEKEEVSRDEALAEIMLRHPDALIIFCNGFTARAAINVKDRLGNYYNAAYMGGGPAIALGAALYNPNLEVVEVSGDGNRQMDTVAPMIANRFARGELRNLTLYTLDNGGAASVDAAIPNEPLAYWHYDLTHVVSTRIDDLSEFRHARVEESVTKLFDPQDAEILKRKAGELKEITKRVRRWVVQEGKNPVKVPSAYRGILS